MREMGYSNVQITEATGVPASTIARWAAEGGWRVRDLVDEPEFKAPESSPNGLLPGLGGESWIGSREPISSHGAGSGESLISSREPISSHGAGSGESLISSREPISSHGAGSGLRAGNEDCGALGDESGLSARASSSASLGRGAPARSLVRGSTPPSEIGDPQATAQAQGVEPRAKNKPEQSRQERLEDALEKAAMAAEDAILRGNLTAAGKATKMADTLSKALERVRNSAEEEKPEGVFYTPAQIDEAREQLTRRLDRLAKTLRRDEQDTAFAP